MKLLHISIVTYKTDLDLLRRCLASIRLSKLNLWVTVIDNSPTDELRQYLNIKELTYVNCSNNPGYGSAHNIAIKKSLKFSYKYHLVLNADVFFDEGVLEEMCSYMDLNPCVGQIMPKVLNNDGSIQRVCKLVPSPADLILRRFIPRAFTQNWIRKFELWDSGYERIMFVPYLSGCFMLLRVSVLDDVGIFDERFFMYPEDIDLTRRIAVKYETLYYPYAQVTHDHGAASYKSLYMLLIHIYNIIKYFNKWGWFFDDGRQTLNYRALKKIKSNLSS